MHSLRNEILSILVVNDDPDMLDILALSLALDSAINLTLVAGMEDDCHLALEQKDYDVILIAAELTGSPDFGVFYNRFLAKSVSEAMSLLLIDKSFQDHDFKKVSILSKFDATIIRPFDPLGLSVAVRKAHEKAQGISTK